MKHHVNPETGVVGPCRAKTKCPFGGVSGEENHFATKAEATTAAEELMQKKFPSRKFKKKPSKMQPANPNRDEFQQLQKNIRTGLLKYGLADADLPPVSSEDEIVEKWFAGDRKKFELVSRISDPRAQLTDSTKKSVSGLVKKGAAIGFSRSSNDFDTVKKSGFNEASDVDLIDDFEDLDSIKNGDFDFFKR